MPSPVDFMVLKAYPFFLQKQMYSFFQKPIDQGFALVLLPIGMIVFHRFIKMIGHPFSKSLKNNSILKNTHTTLKLKLFPLLKRITKMFVTLLLKLKLLLNKVGTMNTPLHLISNVMKFLPAVFLKN